MNDSTSDDLREISFTDEGKSMIIEFLQGGNSLTFSQLENSLENKGLVIKVDQLCEILHPEFKYVVYRTSNFVFFLVITDLIEECKVLVVPKTRIVDEGKLVLLVTEFRLESSSDI